MKSILKPASLIPAVALVVGAIVLAGSALAGNGDLPEGARDLTHLPQKADAVAPAPEGMSAVVVTRDWQEVTASSTKR